MIGTVTSILIALGMGLALICLLWPPQRPLRSGLPAICFLSVGFGLGMSSLLFFLWLVIFGPPDRLFRGFETLLLLGLAIAAIASRRRHASDPTPDQVNRGILPKSTFEAIAAVVFAISIFAASLSFRRCLRAGVNGGWDAWGIWNLRAKFLYLGGTHWQDAFSRHGSLTHTDYPLLIPASVARGWSYAGSDLKLAPILIAALFTAGTVGLLFSSLCILRNRSQALLAATVLLASQFFIVLGTAQYADVPLGCLLLATLALICLHEVAGDARVRSLAGAAAALAAWTKNEGNLFLVCLMLAHMTVTLRAKGWQGYWRQLAALGAGIAPVLLVLIGFKLKVAGGDGSLPDAVTALKMIGRIFRWREAGKAFADQLLHFGGWPLPMTALLALYVLVTGLDRRELGTAKKICLRALLGTFAGYFFVYLTTPLPLKWLLETSLNRVLMQLWPSALLLVFLFTKPPDQQWAMQQK